MRRLDYLNLLLLSILVAASLQAWPTLPERFPRHFDARGVADAWAAKSVWAWFMLPALGAFILLLLQVTARATERRPSLLNIPSKKQFLALPPDEQAPILREMRVLMQLLGTMILLLFGTIQLATYRAALGQSVQTLMLVVLVGSVASGPVLAIVMLVRTNRLVGEAYRRATLQGTLRR